MLPKLAAYAAEVSRLRGNIAPLLKRGGWWWGCGWTAASLPRAALPREVEKRWDEKRRWWLSVR